MLRGHPVKQSGDKEYPFADDTGQMPGKIDHQRCPAGQPISAASTVVLTGKYAKALVGAPTVKVNEIKVIQ